MKTLIAIGIALTPDHAWAGQGATPLSEGKRDVPNGNNGSSCKIRIQGSKPIRGDSTDVNSRAGSSPAVLNFSHISNGQRHRFLNEISRFDSWWENHIFQSGIVFTFMRYIVYWKFSRQFRRSLMRQYPSRDPDNIARGSVVNALSEKHAKKKWQAEIAKRGAGHRLFVSVKEDKNYKPLSKRELKLLRHHMRRMKTQNTGQPNAEGVEEPCVPPEANGEAA